MTRILTVAALAASCIALTAGAASASDSMLKSGDDVKAIEQDRLRQQQQEQQSGRSATEKPTGTETGAPVSGAEKEKNLLQGVDPAVK